MSRGLGALQRRIMAHMSDGKRSWAGVEDLAWAFAQEDADSDMARPTASQCESVRRAVRTLVKRGLLESGLQKGDGWGDGPRGCPAVCWLPGASHPDTVERVPLSRFVEMVRRHVESAQGAWVEHKWMGEQIHKELGEHWTNRSRYTPQIAKAVRVLELDGAIECWRWSHSGRVRKLRCVSVVLPAG